MTIPPSTTSELQAHEDGPSRDAAFWQIGTAVTYIVALIASTSTWFIAIRAPLWLDETISFFLIKGGLSHIYSRQGWPAVPAYSYVLWFCTKIFGTSEIALRVPEILAMLGAVYLLFLSARELFDREIAFIACVVFCLHPIVVSAAIDIRPYAFAVLAANGAILVLVRLRKSASLRLAGLFGFLAAVIVWFHFMYAVLLPALAIGFFLAKPCVSKNAWRQCGIALSVFTLAFLPVIPGLQYMFRTSGQHVWDQAPKLLDLGLTLAPGLIFFIFLGAAFLAALTRHLDLPADYGGRILLCASLGLIPILILYVVSTETSIHIFVARYRLAGLPGVALCWALLVSMIRSRPIRLLFCVVLVAVTAYTSYTNPLADRHGFYSWKYALKIAADNSSPNTPVFICSDLPEADFLPLPVGEAAKDSNLLAPLSYYKLNAAVIALPRSLTDDAKRSIAEHLQDAALQRKQFLAMAYGPSFGTVYWISQLAQADFNSRILGEVDGVVVVEFTPREGEPEAGN